MKTILVVDDEFGNVAALQMILEDEGYRVLCAANGKQGLDRVADHKPDLIVLDFMMPLMDGAAMGRVLKEDQRFREIPIVMTSAVAEPVVRQRFDGYSMYLRKPFTVADLLQAISRLVGTTAST